MKQKTNLVQEHPRLKSATATPEEALDEVIRRLTPRQLEFVKQLTENNKITHTEAAKRAYGHTDNNVAAATASRTLRSVNVQSALSQYNDLAEATIVGTMQDWGKSQNTRRRELAMNAAMYTHDKTHGKATQRVEQQSVSVDISIDLT